ncbi:MAG: hypothetical protein J5365_03050 [Erysipelotrichaceae bacterium]|nr:hypothetical protein [Erysipelotrichaceae bacterium]
MEKNETLEYLPVEQVKAQGRFIKAIGFKPKTAPLIVIAMGIALLIPNSLYSRLLGILMIALAALVLLKVKDYKVMDIFDQGIMFYGDVDAKYAYFLPFDDIVMWKMEREAGHDSIVFDLGSGMKIIKDTFEANKVYKTLYPLIREKEHNYIKMEKARQNQLSIPEAFDNIKKKYFKK